MNWQPLQRPLQLRSMADVRRLCHLLRGVATPLQIKLAVDAANENAARGQFSPIEFVMANPNKDCQDHSKPIKECYVADGDAPP